MQKENQKQLTKAKSDLNFIANLKTTTLNTAISVDSNKSTFAARQEKKPTNFHNRSEANKKAAVRLKTTNFTRQRTQLHYKMQTKLKRN